MKGIFMMLLMVATMTAFSQVNYKPYVGVGTNLTTGVFSYGGEVGIYNDKAWFSLGASTYKTNEWNWTGSAKAYYKVASQGIVDEFAYAAVNISIDPNRTFSFEPGVAVVFNLSKNIAPQFTLSTALVEGNQVFKQFTPSVGVGLNVFF